ncbi:MAG: redoxin domain-containing protein [Bacteroidetes bacterium]|nr:redoxin domain-containing protein [Bacteroidota bacterium]
MPTSKMLYAFIISFVLTSCNLFGGQKYQTLKADDFAKKISAGAVQLVDVRTPDEYAEKHLKDAVNINFNDDNFIDKIEKLDKTKPVYVYCLSGGRSSKAAALITSKGYSQVYNLDGGLLAWTGAGLPVETPAGTQGGAAKGLSMDDYLKRTKSDKLVLVDFSAVWCGPCKILKPIVEQTTEANKDKVELLAVDVDKNPAVSDAMHITGIPLLILYKNGKEVWRQLGVTDRATLENQISLNIK